MLARHPYRPPAPIPGSSLSASAAALFSRRKDILQSLPASFYRFHVAKIPFVPRDIYIVNCPETIRHITVANIANYPKSDIMRDALSPLVGAGSFIDNGVSWKRKRAMMEPTLHPNRSRHAFHHFQGAIDTFLVRVSASVSAGAAINVDREMSHLTADVIFRTLFSEPMTTGDAQRIFSAFAAYQLAAPQVGPLSVVFSNAGRPHTPKSGVIDLCEQIRTVIRTKTEQRLREDPAGEKYDDIAAGLIRARDPQTGRGYTHDELVDEITVLMLAGHETSASALTWAIFMLAQTPGYADELRDEVEAVTGGAACTYDDLGRMNFNRTVMRETLRLYPPVGFLTRTALGPDRLRNYFDIKPGALLVISPWLLHRHEHYWRNPDIFDPHRHDPDRRHEIAKGAYIPFGVGSRACPGANFGMLESALLLAELVRRFQPVATDPQSVRPAARLTIRPETPVFCRLEPVTRPPGQARNPTGANAESQTSAPTPGCPVHN